MKADYEKATELAQKLTELLPEDAFVSHHTAGMHPVARGICYAEKSKDDSSSHAESRGEIINEAVRGVVNKMGRVNRFNQGKAVSLLGMELMTALEKHGYSTENPAFLKHSKIPG